MTDPVIDISSGATTERVRSRHGVVMLIVAPPRAASTAIARAFWQHPVIGFYSHEPFDADYHLGGHGGGWAALEQPVARRATRGATPDGLVIKEMSFQVGEWGTLLLRVPTLPVVFVIRDPRLSVSSRMCQRRLGGLDQSFPPHETGWPGLLGLIEECARAAIPYVLVDATDVRRYPGTMLASLCAAVGIEAVTDLHRWRPAPDLSLGQLGEAQRHWYERVLSSSGIQPPTERIPMVDEFPKEYGLRAAVADALEHYQRLREHHRCLRAPSTADSGRAVHR